MTPREAAQAQAAAEKAALDRIASNSYPIRPLFKPRGAPGGGGRTGGAAGAAGGAEGRGAGQGGGGGRGGGAAGGDAQDLTSNRTRCDLSPLPRRLRRRANLPTAQQMKESDGEITTLTSRVQQGPLPWCDAHGHLPSLFGDVGDGMFLQANGRPGGLDPSPRDGNG